MIAALKVDEQRPSSDLCGEILALNTSIKKAQAKRASQIRKRWQELSHSELAGDRLGWREMLKSIKIRT
jgi:hypothetical protein